MINAPTSLLMLSILTLSPPPRVGPPTEPSRPNVPPFARDVGFRGASLARAWKIAGSPESVGPTAATQPPQAQDHVPSSAYLGLLPTGEAKRRFILDCTGCHQFDRRIVEKDGKPRSRTDWVARIEQMLSFSGVSSSFPVISAERDAQATADWLTQHLGGPEDPSPELSPPAAGSGEWDVVLREYDLPAPDLPHDVAVAPDGGIVVTGMFTHQMYVLDPTSGDFTPVPIPVASANPRAVEVGGDSDWWVLLGQPRRMARYDPDAREWSTFELGMYPHSIVPDGRRRVWFNGHFSAAPELIGFLDIRSGRTVTFEVPAKPMPGDASTIPYGLRAAPDGTVWGTELAGNRLFSFDPDDERFEVFDLPTAHSGPRRLDIAPDGSVWIPEYAANKLARFDPRTRSFTEYEFPIADALPYVVRVDQRRGTIWIGTAAADAMARFDPIHETFTVYRLPTAGALIRHIDIDETNGTVWGAYSPGPPVQPKVFSLTPRD